MGARRSYPQFSSYTAVEMIEFINLCKFSQRKKEIALKCILNPDVPLIEIGEEYGGISRATLSRWIEKDIVPEIERIIRKSEERMCTNCTQKRI